jgi:hypothetical protein
MAELKLRKAKPKDIRRARELHNNGLSYREISKVLLNRVDSKTIWRWLHIYEKKLSTGKDL